VPPRWFIHVAWRVHRLLVSATGARLGLWPPKVKNGKPKWGALRLVTVGRRSRRERKVIIAYFEDGTDLVCMAMNGWGAAEPAWWLNLQAHPDAHVQTSGGAREIRAHAAQGDERARLWQRWCEFDPKMDAYAALRPGETAIVVLSPR
jgi:deazaflavin-dependent oxidoreductase (nitroreductase family)